MPRCCNGVDPVAEFSPCYASVLVFGQDGLKDAVDGVETSGQGLVSCFTAWCGRCKTRYLLTTDLDLFPTSSAHHTHKLVLLNGLKSCGMYPR